MSPSAGTSTAAPAPGRGRRCPTPRSPHSRPSVDSNSTALSPSCKPLEHSLIVLASIYHLKCRFCLHLERLQPHRIRDSIKSKVCEAVSRAETGTGGTGGEAGIQDGAPCDVTGPPASTQGFFWPLATPLSRHLLWWITAEATWLGEKPEGGTGDKVFRAWTSSNAGPSLTSLSRGSSSPSVSKGPRQMHASDSLL